MKRAKPVMIIVALVVVVVWASAVDTYGKPKTRATHHKHAAHSVKRSSRTAGVAHLTTKSKTGLAAGRKVAFTQYSGARVGAYTPQQLAAMKAESDSGHKILDLLKAGDVVSAQAECGSAMAASAAAHGGVAVPRLRHLHGATFLAEGRYADAYQVFADIGRHNGEVYACDDFDLDVALAAANLGNLAHAESLVRKYMRRFQTWQGRAELLPGFGNSILAIASVRTVRGVNKICTAQWDEAAAELALAAQSAPNNPYVAHSRGAALAYVGRFAEAQTWLQAAAGSGIEGLSKDAEARLVTVREAADKAAAGGH